MTETLEYDIIWKVRRLFRGLAERSDALLKPMGLTAADRAILEFLYPGTAMTVPQIARRYKVSRQHIQVTSNRLMEKGLVLTMPNPDHARSPLLGLTEAGVIQFQAIRDMESDAILSAFEGVPNFEKLIAAKALEKATSNLENDSKKES